MSEASSAAYDCPVLGAALGGAKAPALRRRRRCRRRRRRTRRRPPMQAVVAINEARTKSWRHPRRVCLEAVMVRALSLWAPNSMPWPRFGVSRHMSQKSRMLSMQSSTPSLDSERQYLLPMQPRAPSQKATVAFAEHIKSLGRRNPTGSPCFSSGVAMATSWLMALATITACAPAGGERASPSPPPDAAPTHDAQPAATPEPPVAEPTPGADSPLRAATSIPARRRV